MFEQEFRSFINKFKRELASKSLPEHIYTRKGNFLIPNYREITPFGGTDKLVSRTGKLFNSIIGKNNFYFEKFDIEADKYVFTAGTKVPYARIHEYGGSIPVTQNMRRVFWYYYFINRNSNIRRAIAFKYLALFGTKVTFYKREYFAPSVQKAFDNTIKYLAEAIRNKIKLRLENAKTDIRSTES
ncbi:MAG: hypothetical protein N2043_09710 [Ignavibacterium sp.]|nr:hypothetical protein [Ignavibacterium sp.]